MEATDIGHHLCARNDLDMKLLGSLSLDDSIGCCLFRGRGRGQRKADDVRRKDGTNEI
jgi:hypothetical protein